MCMVITQGSTLLSGDLGEMLTAYIENMETKW